MEQTSFTGLLTLKTERKLDFAVPKGETISGM